MKKYGCLILAAFIMLSSGCVNHEKIEFRLYDGEINTQMGVSIDSKTMQLTFGEDARISYEGGSIAVGGSSHDLSVFKDGDSVYFDPQAKRLTPHDYNGCILLGVFHMPLYLCELDMDSMLIRVDEVSAPILASMHGAKAVCLGDSMTEGVGTTTVYSEYFPELCGFSEVKNYGLGGSCIAPKVDEVPTWENGIASFYERYAAMDGDADFVIVLGGVNDWVTGRTLGASADTGTDTFYGAMRMLCQGLEEKYPNAEIFVFSSPQNNFADRPANNIAGTQWEGNTEGFNRKGHKLADYVQAMEAVCEERNIHFYSLTAAFPWGATELGDGDGAEGIYGSDGLHPNADGHRVIAQEMVRFIEKTLGEASGQ